MAIEQFTREQFEAALPRHRVTGVQLWRLASVDSEYVYQMHVGGKVYINIRSSVNAYTGVADAACQNSIRCWISLVDGTPLSNKTQTYITRVRGWEARLKDMLRDLWEMAVKITAPCTCGQQKSVYLSKKPGPNLGRRFTKCWECGSFTWLEPAARPKKSSAPAVPATVQQANVEPAKALDSAVPVAPKPVIEDCDDFNRRWAEYKNEYARQEAMQEQAAFEYKLMREGW